MIVTFCRELVSTKNDNFLEPFKEKTKICKFYDHLPKFNVDVLKCKFALSQELFIPCSENNLSKNKKIMY